MKDIKIYKILDVSKYYGERIKQKGRGKPGSGQGVNRRKISKGR